MQLGKVISKHYSVGVLSIDLLDQLRWRMVLCSLASPVCCPGFPQTLVATSADMYLTGVTRECVYSHLSSLCVVVPDEA